MADESTFTVEQAVGAQRAMRRALGLPPERFSLAAFVGMISDEIERLRAAGRTDGDIVAMIADATGRTIPEADLRRFYAPPESRRRPG